MYKKQKAYIALLASVIMVSGLDFDYSFASTNPTPTPNPNCDTQTVCSDPADEDCAVSNPNIPEFPCPDGKTEGEGYVTACAKGDGVFDLECGTLDPADLVDLSGDYNDVFPGTVEYSPSIIDEPGQQTITVSVDVACCVDEETQGCYGDVRTVTLSVPVTITGLGPGDYVREGSIDMASSISVSAEADDNGESGSSCDPCPMGAPDSAYGQVGGAYLASPGDKCCAMVQCNIYTDVNVLMVASAYALLADSASASVIGNATIDGTSVVDVDVTVEDDDDDGIGSISLGVVSISLPDLVDSGGFTLDKTVAWNLSESQAQAKQEGQNHLWAPPASCSVSANASTSPEFMGYNASTNAYSLSSIEIQPVDFVPNWSDCASNN